VYNLIIDTLFFIGMVKHSNNNYVLSFLDLIVSRKNVK